MGEGEGGGLAHRGVGLVEFEVAHVRVAGETGKGEGGGGVRGQGG